jgi:hypothetical protein
MQVSILEYLSTVRNKPSIAGCRFSFDPPLISEAANSVSCILQYLLRNGMFVFISDVKLVCVGDFFLSSEVFSETSKVGYGTMFAFPLSTPLFIPSIYKIENCNYSMSNYT